MNGAIAEPLASTISPPSTTIISSTGISQNFLRTRRNAQISRKNDMFLFSELIVEAARRRARRVARHPVARSVGVEWCTHRRLPERAHDHSDRRNHQEKEDRHCDRAHDSA